MATRRERVVLELEDQFTTGMARAAASAALLNRELDSLSRDAVRTRRSMSDIDTTTTKFGRNAERSGNQIDRLSGRMRILADVAAILGPSLVPIGAVGVPAVAGLAAQFGFAATGAGVAILAFQGVGDALKAMNKAALEPTDKNLEAARYALEQLTPAAQAFVMQVDEMRPALRGLRDEAAGGFFPGLTAGLDALDEALPRVQSLIGAVADELGSIAADTGASLASDRWLPFLAFVEQEAPAALRDMADAAGNTVHALAELWMAFQPLNNDFSAWLVDATESLDQWASNLSKTQGFQEFVDYIRESGPQVAETFGAIANAVLQIVEAAAPLGGPVLAGVEALAKAISSIADSEIGTPLFTAAAALALFNRTLAVASATRGGIAGFGARMDGARAQAGAFGASLKTVRADMTLMATTAATAGARTQREMARTQAAAGRLRSTLTPIGKGAGLLGGLAIASTGAADSLGLTNSISLALAGSMAGPLGAAIGGTIGGVADLSAALGESEGDIRRYQETLLATAGSSLSAQLAAVTAELEKQKKLANAPGPDFHVFGSHVAPFTFSNDWRGADDKVRALTETQKELEHQIDLAGLATDDAATVTDSYGNAIAGAGANARTASQQIDALVDSMRTQRQEALAGFSAETRYRQALKDARKQAASSDAGIKGDSDEALKNREAIETLAAAWNNQSDAVKNNRARFLEAKSAFIETATAMGVPIEQARRLARRLLELPKEKVIPVELRDKDALGAIERIKRQLREISKPIRVDYYVNQINAFNKPKVLPGNPDGFASGGWTGPGSKFQPAGVVHADEFVFSKEATNGNVAFLSALHQEMRGYSGGGLVERMPTPVTFGGPSIDYDRLAAAMLQARPLYGPVTMQPHNYSEFKREMEADQRAASIGGIPGVKP